MYLSRSELTVILRQQKKFLTKNVHNFALYRGHFNAQVLTLKYCILSTEFTESLMITSVIKEVMDHFPPRQKSIRGLIEYDVVLQSNPMEQVHESFYLWKANSNRNSVPNNETTIPFTHDSIFLFVRNAANINPSELDVFYTNSNVSVQCITNIVFTFIAV
jgi:hypothetical protein